MGRLNHLLPIVELFDFLSVLRRPKKEYIVSKSMGFRLPVQSTAYGTKIYNLQEDLVECRPCESSVFINIIPINGIVEGLLILMDVSNLSGFFK
jgi:hypothetical protein